MPALWFMWFYLWPLIAANSAPFGALFLGSSL